MERIIPATHDQSGKERRRKPRVAMQYPAKIWCVDTGRFLAGSTQDLSAQGLLVQVDHASLLIPGQRVRVGIAWSSHDMLLSRSQMLPGVVVRSLGHGGTQTVAVCFDALLTMPTPQAISA